MKHLLNEYLKAARFTRNKTSIHSKTKPKKIPHIVILDGLLDSHRASFCKEYKSISAEGKLCAGIIAVEQSPALEHCCGMFDRVLKRGKSAEISVISIFERILTASPKILFDSIIAAVGIGADVINIGLCIKDVSDVVQMNLKRACDYAEKNGSIIVAGFQKGQRCLPAAFNNVIRVRGENLGAPGAILIRINPQFVVIAHSGVIFTKINGQTRFLDSDNGFAAGEVTGIVSAFIAEYGRISLKQCQQLLIKSANDIC
jgi:hypothetical protein